MRVEADLADRCRQSSHGIVRQALGGTTTHLIADRLIEALGTDRGSCGFDLG